MPKSLFDVSTETQMCLTKGWVSIPQSFIGFRYCHRFLWRENTTPTLALLQKLSHRSTWNVFEEIRGSKLITGLSIQLHPYKARSWKGVFVRRLYFRCHTAGHRRLDDEQVASNFAIHSRQKWRIQSVRFSSRHLIEFFKHRPYGNCLPWARRESSVPVTARRRPPSVSVTVSVTVGKSRMQKI